MATVSIYLDKRASGYGEAPMKACISHGGKTALISLGVKLLPSQWDKTKKAVINHPNKKYLNIYISERKIAIEREILKLSEIGKTRGLSVIQIKDLVEKSIYPERFTGGDTFQRRFELSISLKKKRQTIDSYKWTLKRLKEFDRNLNARSFEDITADYLNRLIKSCVDLKPNSINILLRNIRSVFNDAIDAGITTFYPFRRIKMKPSPTVKKALTADQLRTLFSFPCESWNAEYRDMFMLMFLLRGINAIDLFSASLSQVVNGRLEYRRSKVGTLFSVKIEPEAWEIIERYKGKDYLISPLDRYSDYRDYLHHMNDALKSIGAKRGKWRTRVSGGIFPELSSNWARHSWATAGIQLDIPREVVSRGMGHQTRTVTDTYIDFDVKKLDNANRQIIDYILHPSRQTTSASAFAASPEI